MLTWPREDAKANRPFATRSPQPMASRAGVSLAVTPPAAARHQGDDDEDGHRRQPHAPQREEGRLTRPAVEAEQGEPEAHGRAGGQDDRPRRDVAAQLGAGRQGHADDGDEHADPGPVRRRVTGRDAQHDRHDDPQRRDRRDDAHGPRGQRRVEADQPGHAGEPGGDRPRRPPGPGDGVPAKGDHDRDDHQGQALGPAHDRHRRVPSGGEPREEVGGPPHQGGGQGQHAQHRRSLATTCAVPRRALAPARAARHTLLECPAAP